MGHRKSVSFGVRLTCIQVLVNLFSVTASSPMTSAKTYSLLPHPSPSSKPVKRYAHESPTLLKLNVRSTRLAVFGLKFVPFSTFPISVKASLSTLVVWPKCGSQLRFILFHHGSYPLPIPIALL